MDNRRYVAEETTILRAEVGSTIHGIGVKGKDDRDEMGVCCEPAFSVIGLDNFEQYIYRSAEERMGGQTWWRIKFANGEWRQFPKDKLAGSPMIGSHMEYGEIVDYEEGKGDPRSEPGDLDLTIYSLRKWMRLAVAGNPSILVLLFCPEDRLVKQTPLGKELQELAPAIVSKQAIPRFLGYLEAQKQRLLRERGTAHVPNRGDKDAKYASHMLRLGYQGLELALTGRITLPMPEPERTICKDIKLGHGNLDDSLALAGTLAREIRDAYDSPDCILPDRPDMHAVNSFLTKAYFDSWREAGM